ncbi:MAG TPA: hypothetical protein DDW52_05790 [Planctomycetaceae bacterium]|nr:hypothetical protein [Planctomycetaceae bacterium]
MYVLELLIFFVAAAIQAYVGFGYAIFSIPLLLLFVGRDYQAAVVVCNITFLLQSGIMTASVLRHIRVIEVLAVGGLVPVGAWLTNATAFAAMDQPLIRFAFASAFGAYLIYIAQQFLRRWESSASSASPALDAEETPHADSGSIPDESSEHQSRLSPVLRCFLSLLTGFVTGATGVVSGTTGPPLIAYGRFRHWDEEHIRIFLQPVFCWSALSSCVGYWWQGHRSPSFAALNSVVASPSVFGYAVSVALGTGLGLWLQMTSIRNKQKRDSFRWYFYQILRLLGVLMILQQLVSWIVGNQ